MRVLFHPEGQSEVTQWEFDPKRLMESRCEMIERRYAKAVGEKSVPYEQWTMAVLQGQASARRILLWHLQDLDHPGKVRVEDVDYERGALTVEADRGELEEIRKAVASLGSLTESEKEMMLAGIDAQLAALGDDPGKALSKRSAKATG